MTWRGQVPCHPYEAANVVYVEVPKAGCTSVKWALSMYKGGPPPEGTDIHRWTGYLHADGPDQLYEWLDTRWAGAWKFTVVRDPIARFLSFYYGLQPWERGAYGDVNRYVLNGFELDDWHDDIHAVPQTSLVGTDLDRFDYVGRTETMAEVGVALSLAVGANIHIPHENRTTAVRDDLTDRAKKRLREIYRRDVDVLGY